MDAVEGAKMTHATYRHITTLSSGSILLVSALLEREGTKGAATALISLGCFFLCNLLSIWLMFDLAKRVSGEHSMDQRLIRWLSMSMIVLFNFALLSVGMFAKVNFLR
jgi:hypothetical protein